MGILLDRLQTTLARCAKEYPSSEKSFPTEPVSPISNSVAATPFTSASTVASKGVLLQQQQNAAPAAVATAMAYVPERGGVVHSSNDVTSSTVASYALSNGSSAASVIVTTLPSFSPTPSLTFTFTTPTAVNQMAPLLKLSPPVRLPSVPSVRHQTSSLVIQQQQQQQQQQQPPLPLQQQQQQRHHAPSYSPPPHLPPPSSSSAAARPLPLHQHQPQPPTQLPQSHQAPLSNAVSTITSLSQQRSFADRTAAAADMKRKLSNSGTREVHNKLEKNRRAHLKECFELLKNQVPAIQDEKKPSNLTILRTAIRYVQPCTCSKQKPLSAWGQRSAISTFHRDYDRRQAADLASSSPLV
ncbi:hypothetical protein V9T40_013324 [Parthenolecanium corni]|uniref:BHLH domain-containing protein n=1 Tax=Parthenolecanium corni TaxID=536013 RepID=A0AAN9Y5Z9_9HEMI